MNISHKKSLYCTYSQNNFSSIEDDNWKPHLRVAQEYKPCFRKNRYRK
jgi:hypothetical protein